MAVTVFKDVDYGGVFARLGPGIYSGKDLVGCPRQSLSCEDLDNAINSLRVDPGVIVALSDSHAITASGGGARVLIGPADIADLAVLGMNNRISAVLVVPYRAYDSAIPPPDGGATLYGSYAMSGKRSELRRGDYTAARLAGTEVQMKGPDIVSLTVGSGVVVILYAGPDFETALDAVMVVGPTALEDLERVGMGGRVRSLRVLYSDPFDVPGRPTLALGSGRAYTPGGALGYTPGAAPAGPFGPAARYPHQGLSAGALDLLVPESPDPAAPSNWAGGPSPSFAVSLAPQQAALAPQQAALAPQAVAVTQQAALAPQAATQAQLTHKKETSPLVALAVLLLVVLLAFNISLARRVYSATAAAPAPSTPLTASSTVP